MKTKVNQFSDELKQKVVQEYVSTGQSQLELQRKYNIRGKGCISNWMHKFGIQAPSQQQIEIQRIMEKQSDRTLHEQELEAKVRKLEAELEHEKLRVLALNTLIDVAERNLRISIRKKAGARQ